MRLRHRMALLAGALLLTTGGGVASAGVFPSPGTGSLGSQITLGAQISQAVNQGLQQGSVNQGSSVVATAINSADAANGGCLAGCPSVATANNLINSLSLNLGNVTQVMSQQAVNASPSINVGTPNVTVSPTVTVGAPTITVQIGP